MKFSKRIIALALVAFMASASLLGSCSEKENDNILATSSESEIAKESLAAKIPDLKENVILGTEKSADSYGIDLSNFESDGYIIKTQDDSVLIFGKTSEGLTTATNKFVNQHNAGVLQDVTFHEGYRIEKFEIFGTDIAEYVIEYPAENNENMLFAVSELKQLVKKACGAELTSSVGDSGADHVIEFRFSDNAELRDDGFRYFEENGTLVLEGARDRGCMNAVYRFLQNECDWRRLIGGDADLQESDLVSIPEGIDVTETPAFDFLNVHASIWKDTYFNTDRTWISPTSPENSYGPITHACHGLLNILDSNVGYQDQPCFTDESVYEELKERIEKKIQAEIAAGKTLGVDLFEFDIAQTDSNVYCTCEECMDVFVEEGGTHSGAIVRFANRMSSELNEIYPGIVYKIFAYADANKPPVIDPNDLVYVTYCFDGVCSNHPLDASECPPGEISDTHFGKNSHDYAEWFEDWCEKTDNIYVWFYSLDTNFHGYNVIDTIYDDFTYLAEYGVKGIMWQTTNHGLGMKRVDHQLVFELNWNIDMTEDEYYELYDEILEKEYGAGWKYVRQYLDILDEAQNIVGCWDCWGWGFPTLYADPYYDTDRYAGEFDGIVEIMDRAIYMAETPDQIKHTEMLMINALYKGCYSSYFKAYENEDTERMAVLSDRFDRAMDYMEKYGFPMGEYLTVDAYICYFQYESIEDAAWIDWVKQRGDIVPNFERPMPEKYVGIVTTRPA